MSLCSTTDRFRTGRFAPEARSKSKGKTDQIPLFTQAVTLRTAVWIAVAIIAFAWPQAGERFAASLELWASRIAAKKPLLVAVSAAALVALCRIALLPWWPIPRPVIHDEFGYLLLADTFSLGRLANPTHVLSAFFESPYILQHPTYTAKFMPGTGLVMAAFQIVFGHPWFGVVACCACLMAVLIWALQGWLPARWSLLGAAFAVYLVLFSYWMDSYWGGSLTAIGGGLVTGALGRLLHRPFRISFAAAFSLGAVIMMYTRPFEGLLVLAPAVLMLGWRRVPPGFWAVLLIVGLAGAGWLGYYNQSVTGSALRLPYLEYDAQYAAPPHFNILPLKPPQSFERKNMRIMDQWERERYALATSWKFPRARLDDYQTIFTLIGASAIALVPALLFSASIAASRRLRPLLWILLVFFVGSMLEVVLFEHYAAPVVPALLVVLVQGFRHLRVWSCWGRPVGRFLSRAIPATTLAFVFAHEGVRLWKQVPVEDTKAVNYRRGHFENLLHERGSAHLIVVRYTRDQVPHEEWIYNHADIDQSPVVWAQDLGPEENRRLLAYYPERTVWLLKPDDDPTRLEPYQP